MNKKKGSALALVMVFIFFILFISAAMAVHAYNTAKNSFFTAEYEQLYYDAESFLNIAAAVMDKNPQTHLPQREKEINTIAQNILYEIWPDRTDETHVIIEIGTNRLTATAEKPGTTISRTVSKER